MTWIICITAAIVIFCAWTAYGNVRLQKTEYTVKTEKVKSPVRILQLSDFHSNGRLYKKLLDLIQNERYDLIAITGDFINGDEKDYPMQRKLLDAAKGPVYFVSGNHEEGAAETVKFKTVLKMTKVRTLDKSHFYEHDKEINLYGLNEPGVSENHDEIMSRIRQDIQIFEKADLPKQDKFNILLVHRPEGFGFYKGRFFDLILAGHAHGGQARLPFLGGLFAPGQGFLPKYDAGRFEGDGTMMIISRGLGGTSFPIRFNNAPEAVIVNIEPKE